MFVLDTQLRFSLCLASDVPHTYDVTKSVLLTHKQGAILASVKTEEGNNQWNVILLMYVKDRDERFSIYYSLFMHLLSILIFCNKS